jgi:hypothetical protein
MERRAPSPAQQIKALQKKKKAEQKQKSGGSKPPRIPPTPASRLEPGLPFLRAFALGTTCTADGRFF